MTLIETFLAEFHKNEVLSGLVGGSLFAWVLFIAKGIPGNIWFFIKWRFTCELLVFSEDSAFERVNDWLSQLEYSKKSRRLRMSVSYDDSRSESRDVLSPGLGMHVVWYKKRPVFVERTLPQNTPGSTYKRFEDIKLWTLGPSPVLLHELVKAIGEARKRTHDKTIEIFVYRHRWRLNCRKAKRTVESVVLPARQKEALIADIERFLRRRKWYANRGVPYRRGYLFEGPPGSGKTTLAMALAGHFGRPIYALNLGSIANDDQLFDAVSEVPEHGILLIEDIDAAEVGQRQAAAPAPAPAVPFAPGAIPMLAAEERRVTLSGLLNSLDGVFSRDGRILIMTTNHPDKVDAALLRPGRADRREVIGDLGPEEALEMCRRFLRDELVARRFARGVETPIAGAALQELLLQVRQRPRAAS